MTNFKKLYCILISLIICLAVSMVSGCELKDVFAQKLEKPVVTAVGNTIYWEQVNGAKKYDIYKNGDFLSVQKKII